MQLTKKIVMYFTIAVSAIVALMLILMLCGVEVFGKANGDFVITLACFSVGGFFALNSLNMIDKNKIIGYISLGLISLSVVLILIATWFSVSGGAYANVTWAFALLSILFNIIVSSGLDLGKSKLFAQIIVYVIVGITDIFATLLIFGVLKMDNSLIPLLIMVILSVLGIIILKVLAKKNFSDRVEKEKDMVKISKSEYQTLLEKAKKYDEMTKN